MARYRVQTASGRFYDVDLSEGEDIESVVAEIERSEAPAPSAGGGRGFINPPMAGQPQPTVTYSEPARPPAPIDYGQAATDMMGGAVPAPVQRSVMDQPGPVPQTPGYDPMLNQSYVAEVRRDIIGKAAPEDRMGLLTTLAENRTDVLGRAARQILAEVQAENKRINLDQEARAQRVLDAPRGPGNLPPPRPGAGMAPPPVPVPDVFPGISDVMEGRTAQQIAERRMLAQGIRAADEGMRWDEANRVVNLDRDRTVGEYVSDLGVRLKQGGIMARQVVANTIDPTSQWATELAEKMKASQEEISAPEQYRAQQFAAKLAKQPNEWAKGAVMLAEFVTNPTIAVEEVVRQGPLMGAMIAATVFGGGVGGLAVRGAAAVAPRVALADAISGGMVASAGRAAGAAATARGAAAVAAGGDAAGQVYEELTSKKNAQLMRENADVKRLMDEGKTFEEARSEVALTKARLAQSIAATGGAIFGAAGFEGLLAKKIAGQAVGGTAKRAAIVDLTTELADELTTLGAANFAIGQVDPNRKLTQDFGQTAATTVVTTAPTAGASAYLAGREPGVDPLTDAYARANLSTTNPSGEFISPTQTARSAMDVGPSAPARNDAGLIGSTINFTPPDSITAQAGLAPIVVPTAPGAAGGVDVGLPNVPGGLAGGSGVAGGSDPLAGLGGAGRDAAVPGAGGVNAAGALAGDGSAALLGAGATQSGPSLRAGRGERATDADLLARAEQAAGLTEASKPLIWSGRTKTGYANEQDAEQAMATASTVIDTRQTHDWRVEPMGNGRFQIVGYQKGDASGSAVTGAAGQGLAATTGGTVAQQPGAAGAGVVDLGQAVGGQPGLPRGAATVGGAAANEPTFSLRLAPTAPLRAAGQAITILKNSRGVDVELHAGDLTDQQKVASAMARLVGKTVTYMDYVAGPADKMPNGFVIPGKEQNIYLDSKSEDGALFVMMHEGVHALPEPIREKLVATIKGLTKTDMRGDFAQKFGYDANNEVEIDNEIAAFMTQAVSKRQDFWQELRTKMGDGDFAEVAKVILDKLNTFIQGAKSAYGDEFIQRYATDAVAVRDAVSTAYADAMKAQGQQVPAATTTAAPGVTASNRAADVNPLGMYSELSRKLDAGPNQAPVDQWKAYIKGLPQKGVKPDEIEWSGVEDFLELKRAAGQKVTKAEVSEYLKQGGVQVEETVLSDEGTTDLPAGWRVRMATEDDDAAYRYVLVDDNNEVRGEGDTSAEAMADGWDPDSAAERPTKYSNYTLPGGENYREVLLTLPSTPSPQSAEAKLKEANAFKQAMREKYGNGWLQKATPEELERNRMLSFASAEAPAEQYRSNHWDQPNVLAHIRLNDRTDADGKRVLFVEELQSDWGQEGKKKGFKGAAPTLRIGNLMRDKGFAEVVDQDGKFVTNVTEYDVPGLDEQAVLAEANRRVANQPQRTTELNKVPTAPFVTKTEGWLNLALKRVMTMAAEGGYDRVAFADAEPHFKRWGTERIDWAKQPDGSFFVRAKSQEGGEAAGMNLEAEAVARGLSKSNSSTVRSVKELEETIRPALTEGQNAADLAPKIWERMQSEDAGTAMPRREGFEAFYGDKSGMNPKTGAPSFLAGSLKKLLPKVGGGQVSSVSIESTKGDAGTQKWFGRIAPGAARVIQRAPGVFQVLAKNDKGVEQVRGGNFNTQEAAEQYIADNTAGLTQDQLGFDITPAMRDKVATTGLPMFSNRVAEGRQDEAGQVSRAGRADQQRAAQDVQPAGTVPGDTRAPEGSYFVRTIVGSEVSRKLGADTILTPEQAAQATAYLYRSAVERFDGIVTDDAGKPLAVVGGFKGAVSQASVYPATIVAEAVRVPGAARIWFSHNHPSGSSDLSRADKLINETLSDALRGSGIEPMGLLAVAGKQFTFTSTRSDDEVTGTIDAPTASVSVPVIERELAPDGASGALIDSPRAAKSLATQFHKIGGDGIMLLNNRNAVIAWVPATDSMRGILRGTGGLNAIYRAISESNASAAILVHDGSFDETGKFARSDIKVGQNIGAALKKLDVRVLDTIDVRDQSSAAERGEEPAAGPVFSNRVARLGTTEDANVNPPDEIKATGIQFSLRRVEELNDAPTITMQDLVGKTVFPILADLTAAGYVYMGKLLRGGPYYTLLPSNSEKGLIWANDAKGVSSIKEKKAKRGVIGLIIAMKQDSHATNNTVANLIFRGIQKSIKDGEVSDANIAVLDEKVRALAERTKTNKETKEVTYPYTGFKKFPGFANRAKSEKFLRAMTFEERGAFFEEMSKPTVEDMGLGIVRKIIAETVEPDLRGVNMGDAIMAIEFDPEAPAIELGPKTQTPEHDSYRYAVKGRVIGKFARPVSFQQIFKDLMDERRKDGKTELAGNYRSLTLRKPEQLITQQIADAVSSTPYVNIQSPAEAEAAVAAAAGKWTIIEKPAQSGVKEFLRASKAHFDNKAPAFDEAKRLIKDGTLRIGRLGESDNWFAIVDRDGQKVMTSVMVNQPGVRQDTLFGDMVKAAQAAGATHLQVGKKVAPINKAKAPSRVAPIMSELAAMTDNDLVNLGINPVEVRSLAAAAAKPGAAQVSPTAVITPSNRLSPADRIKWREVADVKQEIALDKLPAHIVPFAQFMSTMADKASNGGLTSRDLIKAYTIARSSMNRGAVDTNKVKAAGLVLPASFTDAKIRPEGAFGYWLLSPMGQQYLNAAEVAIVDATSIRNAVTVMAPFGTQNTLGEDLERAATGTLHTRLPALSAAIKKAAKGGDAVKDWQDALDNLYGVREAKKGFLGSLLGFGQLPTFDARQINVNVERDSKEDTLRALSSTRAREVVAILAMRMDALSLTMDPKYAPFYRHLVHHAVWDAVGNTETTHSDVMESMLQASNRAAPEMAESEPVGPVSVIIDGRTMRVPDPAGAVEKLDAKINRYSELLKCLQ